MLKLYEIGTLFFELGKEIGKEGKNSQAFVAKDSQLDAELVIKKMKKSDLSWDRYFQEASLLYAGAHPNVVPIHYACQDTDHIYLAMPYYPNGSLKSFISGGKSLSVRRIIAISTQVLSGLHNIHSKGLIHFDIKPDNILLSDRFEALLTDFGQAERSTGGVAGVERTYLKIWPPEALDTDQFDRTFDIYAFGLTLYRMCNGEDDFYKQFNEFVDGTKFDRDGFHFALRNGKFPDRSRFRAHIPQKLRTIVKKCLEIDPSQRYFSALDIVNAFSTIDGPHLDWEFDNQNRKRVWTKNISGTSYELTVHDDGKSEMYKTVKGGNPKRVTAMCKDKITERDITKALGTYE